MLGVGVRLRGLHGMLIGVSRERAPKAVGTYGFLDVLRHPSRIVRRRKTSETSSDLEAVRRGEARSVSCFLRGTVEPYPHKLKQGRLQLSSRGATWTPFWSFSREPMAIGLRVEGVTTRPADSREPNAKKGGRALGVVEVPAFVVVTCTGSSGALDLVVPSPDEPLVSNYFRDRLH
jgi:hypothetical protein